MKVLIADNFEKSGIEGLQATGCEVVQQADLKDEALTRAIAETQAEVLVVRGTKVTEEMINAGRLALVVRAGAGYNTIDVAAASRRGIYVSNCPGKNSVAVAELTMALILALDRRVPDNVAELRAGRWNEKEYSKARGLQGQTLGLLGAGNIAAEVIRRAAAFGPRRGALEPAVRRRGPPPLGGGGAGARARRRRREDHSGALAHRGRGCGQRHPERPPRAQARDARHGGRRGGVRVDEAGGDVRQHVTRRGRRSAWSLERRRQGARDAAPASTSSPRSPRAAQAPSRGDPIFRLSGAWMGPHHIGASTDQAQEAIAEETVRIVRLFKASGRRPANVVNLAKKSPATHLLAVRHHDRVGVLAAGLRLL